MGVLPVDKAREAASRAYDELQIPVGSPPEHIVATFRTLCLHHAFHINDSSNNNTRHSEKGPWGGDGGDTFQREAVAYRFLRSLPLLEGTEYKPEAILARLRPLEEPRFTAVPSGERASAMLDVCITTMEQAQRTWQLPYTNYVITVHYCLRKHVVRRRYSEFETLHAVLQRKLPVLPSLPERNWLLKLQMPSERAQSLAQYLLRVATMLANRGLFSLELMAFLDIDFTRIRAEEEALAIECLARASGSGGGGHHLFYIISASWLDTWKRFVANGRDPPAKIANGHLLDTPEDGQEGSGGLLPKQGLVAGLNYRCINFFSWQYFALVYGGGPVLIRKTASIYGRGAIDLPTLATLIQKIVRGFLGRQRATRRRLYVLRQDPNFEKRCSAIAKQQLVDERMENVRKYVAVREYQIRHIAITKIQRAFRKFLLRHEHALLMAESAVPNAAETFQHVEEYFSLEEIGLIRDAKYRLAHFLVTMSKGVPIQKLRSRRKLPQWRLFRIDAIGSQMLWSSKKQSHALAFIDITKLAVESPLRLTSGFGGLRRRSTTAYDHAVVLTYKEKNEAGGEGQERELILICESQCDCDALSFGLQALMTETRLRTANGATYVDGHGMIRKKFPHAKRLISDAQELIGKQLRNPFRMNQSQT